MARDEAGRDPRSARPRTRLDPKVRREQILDAAEAVLAAHDPVDVTFEQIAEAAGVSRALVYNYFGDKGGVIAAVYLRNFEQLDEQLERAIVEGSSTCERARAMVETYLRFAADNPGAWKILGTAESGGDPEVQRARHQRYARIAATWGDTAEARMLARAVVAFLEAATFDWLENGDVDLPRAAELIHAQLWSGLSGFEQRTATPA